MPSTDTLEEMIRIRVSRRQKRVLEIAASRRGQTVSDLFRQGVRHIIEARA